MSFRVSRSLASQRHRTNAIPEDGHCSHRRFTTKAVVRSFSECRSRVALQSALYFDTGIGSTACSELPRTATDATQDSLPLHSLLRSPFASLGSLGGRICPPRHNQ